jgi:hypothetical protein
MQNMYKQAIIAGIILASVAFSASAVYADGVTPTATPVQETRVECTTGSYGQQTCKTIVVQKAATPEGRPKHEVVNSGVQENVIAVLLAGFAVSAFGYTYAKAKN